MTEALSPCDICIEAFEGVINALGYGGCEVIGTEFEVACGVAAALFPPPFDVIAEVGCAAATELLVALCEKYGSKYIHDHAHMVATQLCKTMHIC